jgi:ankyrin repeat protein
LGSERSRMATELIDAIQEHALNRAAELLSCGADPNAGDNQQPEWVPLMLAIDELSEGGPIEALILLLRHGAAVEGRGAPGDLTPLFVAAINKQLEAARILLAGGADPNVRDDEGDSPLRTSVEQDDRAMAALLLRCGADKTINTFGGLSGMSALGRAVWELNVPMIELLLDAGADPEALDLDFETALERLPPRETADPQRVEAVMALFNQRVKVSLVPIDRLAERLRNGSG